jgi:hypothetical protein
MTTRKHKKLIHEGNYVAEVEIELADPDSGWSPQMSLEDAYKLDDVRLALRDNNVKLASRYAKVYLITPVAV